MVTYTTFLPRKFRLISKNEPITLTAQKFEVARNQPLFTPWIPIDKITNVETALKQLGFQNAVPSEPQGEILSLSKALAPNSLEWELHIRVFKNGDLKPHIEVNREYFEHLTHPRLYVLYEAYDFYRMACPEFYVKYGGEWISKIEENFSITLPSPSSVTPWRPVVGGIALAAIVGLAIWALSRPPEEE